jgi:uncharacterized membrane protein YagU involved in acid resistance
VISVRRRDILTSVIGGLSAGTLDIGAAALIYWVGPRLILQAIAAGLLGDRSFAGGAQTAMLGLILQWAMSCVIAAIYVIPAQRWTILSRSWIASGVLFGLATFVVMNFVVVPLSAVGKVPTFTALTLTANLAAMVAFGLIISGTNHWRSR